MTELQAHLRDRVGKKVRGVRAEGLLPAVVYGREGEAESISVPLKDFIRVWKVAGESTLFHLNIKGNGTKNVLIHDVAFDPVRDNPIHVDFYEAPADRKIKVHVPVVYKGEAEAVKALGGILVKVLHEVEVEALPKDLPHEISVDVSLLKTLEDQITFSDISMPTGVILLGDADSVIVKVEAPRTEEELAELSQTKEVNLDDIEVTQKGKKEESDTEESKEPALE